MAILKRDWAQKKIIRNKPDTNIKTRNNSVNAKRNSMVLTIFRKTKTGLMYFMLLSVSGSVSAAKKGSMALILIASTNEETTINMPRIITWRLRLGVRCQYTLEIALNID
jgi:hypothetical protein